LVTCLCVISTASEAHAQIVALGASNTRGKGVASDETYSARLEGLLRSHGITVTVANAGVDNDTLWGMLNRLDRSVPLGTRVVILQVGAQTSRQGKQAGDWEGEVSTLRSRIEARGVRVIVLGALRKIVPADAFQADGIHLTPAGHAMVAEWLLPQVMEAIKPRGEQHGTPDRRSTIRLDRGTRGDEVET
jgi:acyl-CoA thioesterase I